MGKRDLPDTYIATPKPKGHRLEGEGVYIRQILIAHIITTILHCMPSHVSNKLTKSFETHNQYIR